MPRIYLDHAATTPVRPEVVEAMLPFYDAAGYNPSSAHAEGRAARAALDDARERIARVLGAKAKEIVFTGSGSEADNLAIAGVAKAARGRGRHLVSVVTEHHAVLHSLDALREEGWEVTLLPVDSEGRVDPQAFAAALRDDTVLASVAYANNEIGTVAPIGRLAASARERGALFHTDAVQAPAYLPLDVGELGVDLLSLAAHKFYGPKGVGALFVREGTPVASQIHGGGQEFAKRAGTENVAGIVGMARALELAVAEREEAAARTGRLRDRLQTLVRERLDGVRVNGGEAPRLPNNLNLAFSGIEGDRLLARLDLDGLAVSAGSACASGVAEPSHVVAALGLSPEWSRGVVRLSLGRLTTEEEITRAGEILERGVSGMRAAFGFSNQTERGILGARQGTAGGGHF
ncbi:MAG TPA: cysteine desulfurase family protein [Candidatus Rubrimentiphilum sp.]|nr:cysteine desulfurase family protein [Candidatus Rubrimentiphilum sp.]